MARVQRGTRLVNLRFKISRFLNQDGGKLRVGGCLGELEKRRRLTHEIIPALSRWFPFYYTAQKHSSRKFGSVRMCKSEHVELRSGLFRRRSGRLDRKEICHCGHRI